MKGEGRFYHVHYDGNPPQLCAECSDQIDRFYAALRRAAEEARDEQAREDAETALTFQTIGHLVPNGKGGVEWESYGEWIAEKIRSSRPSAFVSDCERKQFMQDHDSEMSGERENEATPSAARRSRSAIRT